MEKISPHHGAPKSYDLRASWAARVQGSNEAARNNIANHLQANNTMDGRTVKPINAAPRSNLPSNAHGISKLNVDWSFRSGDDFDDWEPSNARRPVNKDVRRPQSPANRARAPDSQSTRHSSASRSHESMPHPQNTRRLPHSGNDENTPQPQTPRQALRPDAHDNLPPHLRRPSSTTSSKAVENVQTHSNEQSSVASLESAQRDISSGHHGLQMNAGRGAKSAKFDSPFPCSYEDCTLGFVKLRDLKRHKDKVHDWCSKCELDFDDDVALINHKKTTPDMHLCCAYCGDDFQCEAGRNRHIALSHREKQRIECPGCGIIFEKGSSLIAHVQNNRCKDPTGLVNDSVLSDGRVDAALELERLAEQGRPPTFIDGEPESVDASSVTEPGGVPIANEYERSIMDMDGPIDGSKKDIVNILDDDMDIGENPADRMSNTSDTSTATRQDWPKPGEKMGNKGKQPEGQVIQGLEAFHLDSNELQGAWANNKPLFPNAKPTPVVDGWTPPQPTALRRHRAPSSIVSQTTSVNTVRTDWDRFPFQPGVDGRFMCPFERCGSKYITEESLKTHLTSGYHRGTDHRCIKCLKIFKSPMALTAHMESSSQRCNVRDTQHFGQILEVVSGGFLTAEGGRLRDGMVAMQAPTLEELDRRNKAREEARAERDRRLAEEW